MSNVQITDALATHPTDAQLRLGVRAAKAALAEASEYLSLAVQAGTEAEKASAVAAHKAATEFLAEAKMAAAEGPARRAALEAKVVEARERLHQARASAHRAEAKAAAQAVAVFEGLGVSPESRAKVTRPAAGRTTAQAREGLRYSPFGGIAWLVGVAAK
ncbi:MAG: hypothetical protein WC730_02205 [Patescibacteria group bacterium]|jgi:hypothetical protein